MINDTSPDIHPPNYIDPIQVGEAPLLLEKKGQRLNFWRSDAHGSSMTVGLMRRTGDSFSEFRNGRYDSSLVAIL